MLGTESMRLRSRIYATAPESKHASHNDADLHDCYQRRIVNGEHIATMP